MKRESTLKFISKRIALLVAFMAVYLLLALGGNAAHAEGGEFKGLEISPAAIVLNYPVGKPILAR